MLIDEEKKHVLTNYEKVKHGGKAHDTDHATQIMDVNLSFLTEKPERRELLNFNDSNGQDIFRNKTSNTSDFSECFKNDLPLAKQIENWRSVLQSYCKQSFKKIRINRNKMKKPEPKMSQLIDIRNALVAINENPGKINDLNLAISELEAAENRNKIMDNVKKYSDNPENMKISEVWKTLRKLWPKCGTSLPSAKKNHKGKVISCPRALKKLLVKEYKQRLRCRPSRPDLQDKDVCKNIIFQLKLKLAQSQKSSDWNMKDLEKALNDLKRKKSRDHEGFINEIFKLDVIGDDLKHSLLIMFNKLKKEQMIPIFMNLSNITTVPKKGSRLELLN